MQGRGSLLLWSKEEKDNVQFSIGCPTSTGTTLRLTILFLINCVRHGTSINIAISNERLSGLCC